MIPFGGEMLPMCQCCQFQYQCPLGGRAGAGSVEEAEEPEGDAVGAADFEVVEGEVGIGGVGDLAEGLAGAADLEEVTVVDEEIAARGVGEDVPGGAELVEEEGFAEGAGVGARDDGGHEVGVVAIDFAGGGELLEGFPAGGGEKGEKAGALEGVEHFEPLFAVGAELAVELFHFGRLGGGGGQDGEHAARLADGGGLDVLDFGVVDFEGLVGGLDDAGKVVVRFFLVEGVVAAEAVGFEVLQDGEAGADGAGEGDVTGEEAVEGDGGEVEEAFEGEIFAEREAGEGVGGLAAGEVGPSFFELEEGGAGVDDGEAAEVVVEALDEVLPVGDLVDFVEEEVGAAVAEVVLGEGVDLAGVHPDVVEGDVEGFSGAEGLLRTLEHERGLADATGAFQADEACRPVDLSIEGPFEGEGRLLHAVFRDGEYFFAVGFVHGDAPGLKTRYFLKNRVSIPEICRDDDMMSSGFEKLFRTALYK